MKYKHFKQALLFKVGSVNHVFLKENLSLSKSTAKEEVCTVGLFEDRL